MVSASLRDVFLWMNEHYARKGLFFPDTDGVCRAAEAVSHSDLGWFFRKYVAGTENIPWDDFFKTVGLHLSKRVTSIADLGFVATRNFDAALVVSAVTPGGAAEAAGLVGRRHDSGNQWPPRQRRVGGAGRGNSSG